MLTLRLPIYPPNKPPTIDPNRGIGIKNYPIIAPDTAEPKEVPVEMTNLVIGTIFLEGVLTVVCVLSAC